MSARVLHLAESPYMGGITSHLVSVARAFQSRSDVEIVVAALPGRRSDSTLFDALRALDRPAHLVSMRSRFDPRAMRALRELVAAEKIDLVHTHNYRATLLCALARLPVPIVNTCHGMVTEDSWKLRLWQSLEVRAMQGHAATVAVSGFVREWLAARGLEKGRVRTVYNGYRPDESDEAIARGELHIPDDALIVLFVGRMVPGKGVDLLLEAARGLPNLCVVVVGDGPLRANCEAIARAGRIDARFVGAQRNPAPYYRMAEVVALPSRMEALPMALIEGAAYGLPAIATRAGGIAEVVIDGTTGLLTDVGSVPQLRNAIERMTDSTLRMTCGAAARARWAECFSLDRMGDELADLYHATLAGGRQS